MRYIKFFTACLLFLASCQKRDETAPQPAKVNIAIQSPELNTEYKKGDTVYINADVSYISQMHGYTVRITDKNTGKQVWEMEDHVHTDKFAIAEKWIDTMNYVTTLEIEIKAIIDHNGNEAKTNVEILSQP